MSDEMPPATALPFCSSIFCRPLPDCYRFYDYLSVGFLGPEHDIDNDDSGES